MTGRVVFIRDMMLMADIGVYPHEHGAQQRVRLNLDLSIDDDPALDGIDRLSRTVDYAQVAETVRGIVAAGHVKLVETLAERIAAACLAMPRVHRARVRVEKLDVFADAASAGVELVRGRG